MDGIKNANSISQIKLFFIVFLLIINLIAKFSLRQDLPAYGRQMHKRLYRFLAKDLHLKSTI
jgi:hypothetical protein